jgi:hypothetical protein
MARRSRKRDYRAEHRPVDVTGLTRGWERGETGIDGREWRVRTVAGGDRSYRCPGCQQAIGPGTPHVVAWPADHLFGNEAGLDDRRHWHTACWRRRR